MVTPTTAALGSCVAFFLLQFASLQVSSLRPRFSSGRSPSRTAVATLSDFGSSTAAGLSPPNGTASDFAPALVADGR